MPIVDSRADAELARLSSLRVALKRIQQTSHAYFARALADRTQRCLFCGAAVQPVIVSAGALPESFVWPDSMRAYAGSMLTLPCQTCGALANETVNTYVAACPEVQAFRRIYPRLAPEPERVEHHAGVGAIQVTFHAVTHAARLRLFVQPHTLQTLAAYPE